MITEKKLPLPIKVILTLGFAIGLGLFIYAFQTVLNGPHQHRQADSAFVGYFFCTENTDFLHPHIAPRGLTEGTAINEFPVYGAILGGLCKLKGSWDEATPRIISLLLALVSALFFWGILIRKYNLKNVSGFEYIFLFIFLPVNWTFFTIPMPDSTGLFFYSLAGLLWADKPKNIYYKLLGAISFCLGFLIRPYYILILFFLYPGLLMTSIIFVVCIGLFWFWYRYWSSQVTTFHGYFGIQFQSTQEVLKSLPNAFAHLPVRIAEHTALIGLWAFALCWKKYRWVILFYLANVGMMYVLKSTHVAAHGYYLLNAGLFASFVLILGYQELSTKQRAFFLSFFFIYTTAFTQHNFHKNKNYEMTIKAAEENPLNKDAVVATYLGQDPEWLYYLKRTGFIIDPQYFGGQCPEGATHYLVRKPENANELKLGLCPKN